MFFIRSMAFVSMFAAGVFYSILDVSTPLWIGFGILLGMMLLDVSFGVYAYYNNRGERSSGDVFLSILQRLAFYSILLLIMLAASLVATRKANGIMLGVREKVTFGVMIDRGN